MKKRCVVMLSGGLDSQLAARMMLDQGIEVIGLYLYTGLCIVEQKRRTGRTNAKGEVCANPVFGVARELDIPLEVRDISESYLDVIANPKHGRGSGANPCRDCRIHLIEHAQAYMQEIGADFVVTGEVIGQRPMSQVRVHMEFIHSKAPFPDLVLSPLSARMLEPTLPEREGWVDRERLLDLNGRSRKPQLKMAQETNLAAFDTPAGGCCFLTDVSYSRRFLEHLPYTSDEAGHHQLSHEDVLLLSVGRHFRVGSTKLIVGRNEADNRLLHQMFDQMYARYPAVPEEAPRILASATREKGPTGMILPGKVGPGSPPIFSRIKAACEIFARHLPQPQGQEDIRMRWNEAGDSCEYVVRVQPAETQVVERVRV